VIKSSHNPGCIVVIQEDIKPDIESLNIHHDTSCFRSVGTIGFIYDDMHVKNSRPHMGEPIDVNQNKTENEAAYE